jgi:uncharacterized protein
MALAPAREDLSGAGHGPLSRPEAKLSPAAPEHALSTARTFADLGHGATAGRLANDKLFLEHGPVNLVIAIDGPGSAKQQAEALLLEAFPHWLGGLVQVLPRLRTPAPVRLQQPADPIAAAMAAAVMPYAASGVSPMAAVAGAIADAAIKVVAKVPGLDRAIVNNGGDIALHLCRNASCKIGIVADAASGELGATVTVDTSTPVRGVATSGWRGRSHSLGIADAVTVLAHTAAAADAAATTIASATNASHDAIERAPANTLDDDSDLGARLVTLNVGALDDTTCRAAIANGARVAHNAFAQGHIYAAALCVQGHWRFIGAALNETASLSSCAADTDQGLERQ